MRRGDELNLWELAVQFKNNFPLPTRMKVLFDFIDHDDCGDLACVFGAIKECPP
jgi:hypothetical protein